MHEFAVEVEVLGAVVVHLGQRHPISEERVPSEREVHAASQGALPLGVEVSVQRVDGSIKLPCEAGTTEDQRAAARPEVVDHVEGPCPMWGRSPNRNSKQAREPVKAR
jgi:hypothetical protein